MSDSADRLTVFADYVCPFCYLGRRSLLEYERRRDAPLEVDWHPFDLRGHKRDANGDIDHSVDDGKDEAYFEQVRENVERLQDRYDAEEMLGLADIPDVDSLDAQVLSLYAKREHPDTWRALDAAIYEALWVDGRDIGDRDVLLSVAADVGLPEDGARAALSDSELRDAVFESFEEARQLGVTGVPTFQYGEHAARGAVPPEQLERLIQGN